jgi:hypothetical protein
MIGPVRRCVTLMLACAGIAGCLDQFIDCRKVAGSYCLERWEDGQTYYLLDGRRDDRPGGAIEGVVRAVAWGPDLILVDRKPLFGGDPEGWIVIDARKHTVRGPITDAEATATIEHRSLRSATAAAAWNQLR